MVFAVKIGSLYCFCSYGDTKLFWQFYCTHVKRFKTVSLLRCWLTGCPCAVVCFPSVILRILSYFTTISKAVLLQTYSPILTACIYQAFILQFLGSFFAFIRRFSGIFRAFFLRFLHFYSCFIPVSFAIYSPVLCLFSVIYSPFIPLFFLWSYFCFFTVFYRCYFTVIPLLRLLLFYCYFNTKTPF